jgi:hypothetical protein
VKNDRLLSDQLFKWSDTYEESICHITTQKKKSPGPPTTARRGHPSRVSDRTLQEMWKTRLPVCQRTGTRAQILSFDKPNREKPSDGLYPPGLLRAGRSLPGELSINQGNPERNLRYQLRASQPQREAIGNKHAFWRCHRHRHRHRRGRHVGCQYDRRTVKGSVAGNFKYGGKA